MGSWEFGVVGMVLQGNLTIRLASPVESFVAFSGISKEKLPWIRMLPSKMELTLFWYSRSPRIASWLLHNFTKNGLLDAKP